jgi:hypothetical protein
MLIIIIKKSNKIKNPKIHDEENETEVVVVVFVVVVRVQAFNEVYQNLKFNN